MSSRAKKGVAVAMWIVVATMGACNATVVSDGSTVEPDAEYPGTCELITDALQLSFRMPDGRGPRCGMVGVESYENIVVSGTIRTVDGGWAIDSCPPDADCADSVTTVSVSGGGAPPTIADGAMVQLTIRERGDLGGTCFGQAIWIDNLPTWEGAENPVSSGTHRWLVAGFGISSLPSDGPIGVERVAACGADGEDYQTQRVEDVMVTVGTSSIRVGQGVTAEMTVDSGPDAGRYEVKNVRCQYGCCHGGPCEFWVARVGD